MIFAGTACLAVAVTFLFTTTIAAPVPTDRSSVDHNLQSSVGASIMIPLEERVEEITPRTAKAKHKSAITGYNRVSKTLEKVKENDPDLAKEADALIASNDKRIKSHRIMSELHGQGRPDVNVRFSHAQGTAGMLLAKERLDSADIILKAQKAAARAKAIAEEREKEKEIVMAEKETKREARLEEKKRMEEETTRMKEEKAKEKEKKKAKAREQRDHERKHT